MNATELTEAQWCVLDLLVGSRQKGVMMVNRLEILNNRLLPDGIKLKLAFAALTMPKEFLTWHGEHDFSITPAGEAVFAMRYPGPSEAAERVICLPGPDQTRN